MFRFYKTIIILKTRLQEQNLKKILIFFHYHLNLLISCKTKLNIKFMFYRMRLFYRIKFLNFNRIKVFERGYKYLNFFEKKDFVKIIHIFFLKMYIFYNLVLLHLNNRMRHLSNDI